MSKTNSHRIFIILVSATLFLFSSCSSDADPGGKIWWTLIGFPLLGVAYLVGGLVMSFFQSKQESAKTDSPEPVPAIIVGAITMLVLYGIFKAIF